MVTGATTCHWWETSTKDECHFSRDCEPAKVEESEKPDDNYSCDAAGNNQCWLGRCGDGKTPCNPDGRACQDGSACATDGKAKLFPNFAFIHSAIPTASGIIVFAARYGAECDHADLAYPRWMSEERYRRYLSAPGGKNGAADDEDGRGTAEDRTELPAGDARADDTAFDRSDHHYDPKSRQEAPTWYLRDVRHVETFAVPLDRALLADQKELRDMMVLRRGARLSIQPVTPAEFKAVVALARKLGKAGTAPTAKGKKPPRRKASKTARKAARKAAR